ncbi:MAG: hypothetical protein K0V04_38660, partial [Deltaproteobacteria bacterium]|nr:hypothetical protein [Deltaproteobacteria bacterium]
MSSAELQVFVEACGSSTVADEVTLETLDGWISRAQQAWPEAVVDAVPLARALGEAVAAGVALDKLDPAEVQLAVACAERQPAALRAFETHYLGKLPRMLGHMGLTPDDLADVSQDTRRKLLLTKEDGRPRLVAYAGRGQLGALVRVVATRAALDQRRTQRRRRESPADDLSAILLASANPEAAAGFERKQGVFRAAFEAAVAGLPAADRTLLRMYAIDGVGLDGLAAVVGVHRSTAARRLAKIR